MGPSKRRRQGKQGGACDEFISKDGTLSWSKTLAKPFSLVRAGISGWIDGERESICGILL